jgi:hypothetical protein
VSTGIQQQQQQQQPQQKDLALKFLLSFAPYLKSKEHWDPAKTTTTTTTKGLLSFFLSFVCTSFLEIKRALGSSNKLKGLLSFLLSFFCTFSESKEQWDSTTTTTTTTGLPYFFLSFFLSCFFAFATTSENEKGIGICNSNNKSTDQQLVSECMC